MKISTAHFVELQKLCHRSFPNRLSQRLSPLVVRQSERGTELMLTISWRDGGQTRVERLSLRRYADRWTWWQPDDRHKARREWALMRWLYGLGWPIPRLYACSADDEEPFLLMATPRGSKCLPTPKCVEEMASLLVRLHALTPPPEVRHLLPSIVVADELCRLEAIARQCSDKGLAEAVSELLSREVQEYPPCVLHGDPAMEEWLCDARGIIAVAHWENGAYGDPRWDVGRAVARLRRADCDMAEHLYRTYCRHSGRPFADLAFWETLAAVGCWAALERADRDGNRTSAAQREMWEEMAWSALTRLRHRAD